MPEHMLVLTFTRAAAQEMRERFFRRAEQKYPVVFGTFHSVCYHILQVECHLSREQLLTGEAKKQLLKEAVVQSRMTWEEDLHQSLSAEISRFNNQLQSLEEYQPTEVPAREFREAYCAYQALKEDCGRLDFDDLLRKTYALFSENPPVLARWRKRFEYYLVDEVQDMNRLQWELLYQMAAPLYNIFAVGDDDQAIYGFRGSSPGCMQQFVGRFEDCRTVMLPVNYRCPQQIVSASLRLISHNCERFSKDIAGMRQIKGNVETISCPTPEDEYAYIVEQIHRKRASGYAYGDMAVLYRRHDQSVGLLRKCEEEGIPTAPVKRVQNPYRHWVIGDLEAYLRMAVCLRQPEALRVMNRPMRYLSRAGIDRTPLTFDAWIRFYQGNPRMQERVRLLAEQIRVLSKLSGYSALHYIRKGIGYDAFLGEYAASQQIPEKELLDQADFFYEMARGTANVRALLEKLEQNRRAAEQRMRTGDQETAGVNFYTLHAAKGLEFPIVFLPDLNEGMLPLAGAESREAVEEERRLCYVGMTRAAEELHMCCLQSRNGKKIAPSRFLLEMQEEAGEGGYSASSKAASSNSSSKRSSTIAYSASL